VWPSVKGVPARWMAEGPMWPRRVSSLKVRNMDRHATTEFDGEMAGDGTAWKKEQQCSIALLNYILLLQFGQIF
jgi:hypothetical protein